jgi:hypothetical protein
MSLFDERNLFEFEAPEYPGERLIACRNPFLADKRDRVRQELLSATENDLGKIKKRVSSGRLKSSSEIGLDEIVIKAATRPTPRRPGEASKLLVSTQNRNVLLCAK